MIGKSLSERHVLTRLDGARAAALLREALASHARHLVDIRAQDERMIACLFVRADKSAVRLAKTLGFELARGSTTAFGLLGEDAARILPDVCDTRRAWLETPCGPRETKVYLVAGGTALLSIEARDGRATIDVLG